MPRLRFSYLPLVLSFLCSLLLLGCDSDSDSESNTTVMMMMPDDGDMPGVGSLCGETLASMQMRLNEARAQPRNCGNQRFEAAEPLVFSFPAAGALTENLQLIQAAEVHSDNMANFDFFSHTGLNGDTVADRVSEQGYLFSAVGENIAAGQSSVQEVVDTWLTSEGHCRNIMNPVFTEFGAACSENADSMFGTYWTLVLAAPQ